MYFTIHYTIGEAIQHVKATAWMGILPNFGLPTFWLLFYIKYGVLRRIDKIRVRYAVIISLFGVVDCSVSNV